MLQKIQIGKRSISTLLNRKSPAIICLNHGQPIDVLNLNEFSVMPNRVVGKPSYEKELADESQLVGFDMLASPINPADINQIQGVYPLKPLLPAVGGNEGVGVVTHVGANVKGIQKGDWFIPAQAGFGTWRKQGVWHESQIQKIEKDVPLEFAATLSVNPCTAYRMLKDFVNLQKGEALIQNAANGGVGKAIIQLAHHWGLKTVNIIRKKGDYNATLKELYDLGATVVVSEEELVKVPQMNEIIKSKIGDLPKLALNAVGGDNATYMSRYLREGGTVVTYGGMSKKPVTVPTGSFIFKDHIFRGFWMTRWSEHNSKVNRKQMLLELCQLAKGGMFKVSVEKIPFTDFKKALTQEAKQLLIMS